MKTISKLKLNQLDKRELSKKEKLEIRGGCECRLVCDLDGYDYEIDGSFCKENENGGY